MLSISWFEAKINFRFTRLAVLQKWRSKYSQTATYRNLASCFYSADRLEMVEAVCQAMTAPSDSVMGQQQGMLSNMQLHAHL